MTIIPVYRYLREDGGVTVSTVRPEGTTFSRRYRLIADEGKAITDGSAVVETIDVRSYKGWSDCEKADTYDDPAAVTDPMSAIDQTAAEREEKGGTGYDD